MTAAFQDFSGSGFTSDSEGANANLDINMSEDSARNLWDVQAAVAQIAADFQTAVRAASDFNSYLISIRETSQTVNMPSLGMEGGDGGNMSYSGGRVDAPNLGGAIQSEIGMAQRIGEMESNSSGVGGGALAVGRQQHPADVGGFVNQMTTAAWMMQGMMGGQHGGGGAPPPPPPPRAPGQGNQRGGGYPQAFTQAVQQGLPAAQQFLRGGGLGGGAALLGRLGTYGAVGYAAYQLADAGMETYVQSRATAISANNPEHGVGWGFGQRLGQAGMALSPFVTQEEAAQIYGSAISQGWASREGGFAQGDFGQAVNFMYGAAKDYNMTPDQSAQLLQTNTLQAGQSIQTLSSQLLTLKQTVEGTGVSVEVASAGFQNLSGQLIAGGAGGERSALVAGGIVSAFSGDTYLGSSGRGPEIISQTLAGKNAKNILGALTGTTPGAALGKGHIQGSMKELDRINARLVKESVSMSKDEDVQADMLRIQYNAMYGTDISLNDAKSLINDYGKDPNFLQTGQDKFKDHIDIKYEERNAWDVFTGDLKDRASTGGGIAWANPGSYIGAAARTLDESGFGWLGGPLTSWMGGSGTQNTFRSYSPEVQTILNNSPDKGKVSVVDENGNVVATGADRVSGWFADEGNQKKFSATGSKYTIKDFGSNQTWNGSSIGLTSAEDLSKGGKSEANTLYIELSSDAKRLIDTNKDKFDMSTGYNSQ